MQQLRQGAHCVEEVEVSCWAKGQMANHHAGRLASVLMKNNDIRIVVIPTALHDFSYRLQLQRVVIKGCRTSVNLLGRDGRQVYLSTSVYALCIGDD